LPPRVAALRRSSREIVDGATGEVRADGEAVGPVCPTWKGRNKPHRADRRWVQGWSPQQISERLKLDFVDDESMRISHEAIYQALYIESRGALRRELWRACATGERFEFLGPGRAKAVGACHRGRGDQRATGRGCWSCRSRSLGR
jgi:hypothetical protein